jgi:CheY-like chemotaxis protein
VLMDVQMPVMDGYTAARLLRERGCTAPVLALTANAMKGFEREIEAAGFSGYLTKPVDIDAMLAELALHLEGQRGGMGEVAALAHAEPLPAPVPNLASAVAPGGPVVSRLANHPRLHRVVRNFALQLPEKLQAMLDAQARGDLSQLSNLAHWLKGAGGTVGYDALFEPARDLEERALSSDIAGVATAIRQLQALALRIVIPRAPTPTSEQSTPVSASEGAIP